MNKTHSESGLSAFGALLSRESLECPYVTVSDVLRAGPFLEEAIVDSLYLSKADLEQSEVPIESVADRMLKETEWKNLPPVVPPATGSTSEFRLCNLRLRREVATLHELDSLFNLDALTARVPLLPEERPQPSLSLTRLIPSMAPALFSTVQSILDELGLNSPIEVFSCQSQEWNACVRSSPSGATAGIRVLVTSAALNQMSEPALRFLLGHELAHAAFGCQVINDAIRREIQGSSSAVLPRLGECMFYRWRRKAELSADRAGLILCGDLQAAMEVLIRSSLGLESRLLNQDSKALVDSMEAAWRESPWTDPARIDLHPPLWLRLRSISAYSDAMGPNFPSVASAQPAPDSVEEAIEAMIDSARRGPRNAMETARMKFIALGGVAVLSADREIKECEIKTLLDILFKEFTDVPENVVPIALEGVRDALTEAASLLRDSAPESVKKSALLRLAEVAGVDAHVPLTEHTILRNLAQGIGVKWPLVPE